MREFRLEKFIDLSDAMLWIEQELYDLLPFETSLKAEITFIDGEWRCGIISEPRQADLFDR